MDVIGQRGRLGILAIYLIGLLATSWVALGSPLPPTSERGIWFYSALAALLLGNLLVTPFFTKPADVIAYGVAALLALLAANTQATAATSFDLFIWIAAVVYVVLTLAGALFAIALKDSADQICRRVAQSCLVLSDIAGAPRAIFSVVFLFALVAYHRNTPHEYLWISLAWVVFVGLRPLERLALLASRLRRIWTRRVGGVPVGNVVGHASPGIALVREDARSRTDFGDLWLLRADDGRSCVSAVLDHIGFAEGRWRRALHIADATESPGDERLGIESAIAQGDVFGLSRDDAAQPTVERAEAVQARLVGLIAPNTTIGRIQIEAVRSDLALAQGCLVEVCVGDRLVLYQVVEGITGQEIIQQKNTRGYTRIAATKVGSWNATNGGFDPIPWLPVPNEAAYLVSPQDAVANKEAVGHFPRTTYPVQIDPHLLVTHNAAILGILGVGKSFLALELVERMIGSGIKVVCLDVTDQYATELAQFMNDVEVDETRLGELKAVGPPGEGNCQQNVEEGGSIRQFTAKVAEQIGGFLADDNEEKICIINPSCFEVWKQTSKPFSGQASMAQLSPTEITKIISEVTLNALQSKGATDKARCCIVYEEAHSLIPEWNAVVSEGDKAATNGTARAILQGRKFGLGCLVVTQRTASVTKSILNQCNTVFALRVFDATGMDFLRNYLGNDYASVLSTLDERHAVVFGRASSCRDPVLVRLNDRDLFIECFRMSTDEGRGAATRTAE